jgi:uncharacterized protein (TIGR02099 family)
MMRRHLRLARRGAGYAIAVALVLVALAIGVLNQLMPLAERHPQRIAAWLGERSGRSVAFDRVETAWTRRGPLLQLENLRIGDGDDMVAIGDAEMLVSLYAGLLPGTPFSELRLRGLDLTLERGDDGRWQVRGLPGQQRADADPLAVLEGLGELQVVDGRLAVVAPALGIDAALPRIDLRLRVEGPRVRVGLRAWADDAAAPLDAALDFDRVGGNGRAWAGAQEAALAPWSGLLRREGISLAQGFGRAQAWARLQEHRIVRLDLDATLTGLRLRGAPLRDARGLVQVPEAAFERLQLRARWQAIAGGWRLDAPRLRIAGSHDATALVLDGLLLAGGERRVLVADRLDAGPLLALAALSDRLAPGLRHWLHAAAPRARLADVGIAGVADGPLRVQGRIEGLGFDPVEDAPGVDGVAGMLRGDEASLSFLPDAGALVTVDWPRGFGRSHRVMFEGDLAGWRQDGGWRIATPGLRMRGDGYGAHLRGGLWWQGDGSRPWIDLAVAVDGAELAAARGLWVRHRMPPAAVRWLDDALLGGRVEDGRALLVGDLDDWPFRAAADTAAGGLFHAQARIEGGRLRFHPDWPEADAVDAHVSFVGDGVRLEGTGELAGVPVTRLHAGIDSYRAGLLQVQAEGAGDAAQLLELLRGSPLQRGHGETLRALSARGPARVERRRCGRAGRRAVVGSPLGPGLRAGARPCRVPRRGFCRRGAAGPTRRPAGAAFAARRICSARPCAGLRGRTVGQLRRRRVAGARAAAGLAAPARVGALGLDRRGRGPTRRRIHGGTGPPAPAFGSGRHRTGPAGTAAQAHGRAPAGDGGTGPAAGAR